MGLFQWLFKRKKEIEYSDAKETKRQRKIISPSIEHAKWGEKFLLDFKEGWNHGYEEAEKALASAPVIGQQYWVIIGKNCDMYSGEIIERTWVGDCSDRLLCIFNTLHKSRGDALRAKLQLIQDQK